MLDSIIHLAIQRRLLIIFTVATLVGLGLWNSTKLLIDAVPDITNVQVVINTEAP